MREPSQRDGKILKLKNLFCKGVSNIYPKQQIRVSAKKCPRERWLKYLRGEQDIGGMQLFPFLYSRTERHFINGKEMQPLLVCCGSLQGDLHLALILGLVSSAWWPQPCTQGWIRQRKHLHCPLNWLLKVKQEKRYMQSEWNLTSNYSHICHSTSCLRNSS